VFHHTQALDAFIRWNSKYVSKKFTRKIFLKMNKKLVRHWKKEAEKRWMKKKENGWKTQIHKKYSGNQTISSKFIFASVLRSIFDQFEPFFSVPWASLSFLVSSRALLGNV
jgi:hypothetical protein